jgi:hypothetical protein
MRPMHVRRRLIVAGTVGVTALIATLGIGAGVAGAVPADPPGGSTPVYPSWDNGVVSGIRNTGSDTTFFMMQKIGDLYTGAGLYGCTLNVGTEGSLYNSGFTSAPGNANYYCQKNANTTTSDTGDNWDRTEVTEGVDDVGSGAGQSQLCGSGVLASPLPVDFARSSKPAGTACSTLVETGYAKDSVPLENFDINPASFGTAAASSPYASVNGGNVGDVAEGWLPGNPTGGPYTGTAFTNIANNDNGGAANSTAYRVWCATGATQISDWGQLTNLGPNLAVPNVTLTSGSRTATISGTVPSSIASGQAVTDLTNSGHLAGGTTVSSASGNTLTLSVAATGSGTDNLSVNIGTTLAVGSGGPIGLAVRPIAVNPNSGTESTWASYAESGVSGGGCASNANTNGPDDPNPATATGDNAGQHVALENNSSQIGDYAAADFPGDYASQAIEVATTLYYISNGVYSTNPYSGSVTIDGQQFSGTKDTLNGGLNTTANVLNDRYATSRTLFNIYNTATVRASTAGFLNWICDSQSAIQKEKDNNTGLNYDAELTSTIGSYGFLRLTDNSAVASGGNTPADNVSGGGINTSCASGLNGGSTAGNGEPPVTAVANPAS